MKSLLSKWNHRRKFLRGEKRANETAKAIEAKLTPGERAEIETLMSRFSPWESGLPLVRVGGDLDGGYLLPDDFDGIQALYSPGVDETDGFDLEIASRGIECFLADGTVEEPRNLAPNMHFEKMMIGNGPAETFMSFESWVNRTSPSGDLLLQMDIEGFEYSVLPATPRALLDRFRIIAIELHEIDRMLLGSRRSELASFMDLLCENHVICHLHPNTVTPPVTILGRQIPPVLELTLIRKDRIKAKPLSPAPYPHPLDAPNSHDLPVRDFPKFW